MEERERGNERVVKRENEQHSFSVHGRIRGNETDRETERVGIREAEMVDERLRLCHYDKQ